MPISIVVQGSRWTEDLVWLPGSPSGRLEQAPQQHR
jgi:hypothetical protein